MTTLRRRHLKIRDDRIRLDFRSKGGANAQVEMRNAMLARMLRGASGEAAALFHYQAADGEHGIDAAAVNARLRELAGEPVSAKDLRTWTANVRLLQILRRRAADRPQRRHLNRTIAEVAAALGNTPTVCRRSYIDPALVAAYEAGDLGGLQPMVCAGLRVDERRYLALGDRSALS